MQLTLCCRTAGAACAPQECTEHNAQRRGRKPSARLGVDPLSAGNVRTSGAGARLSGAGPLLRAAAAAGGGGGGGGGADSSIISSGTMLCSTPPAAAASSRVYTGSAAVPGRPRADVGRLLEESIP
jgi:hypothetical protein